MIGQYIIMDMEIVPSHLFSRPSRNRIEGEA
jgi:hypothetical protein